MKYFCNPINIEYKYQVFLKEDGAYASRESADPSIVKFGELFYLFPSMTGGFFTSSDMIEWKFNAFKSKMPIYDYAPDVRVIGDYLYFTASKNHEACDFYRTKDPLNEEFERIEGSFPFWDPNLFFDNGRVYLYWGCSNTTPLYGVELDIDTMKPIGETVSLFGQNLDTIGFERIGENHTDQTEEKIKEIVNANKNSLEKNTNIQYSHKGNSPYIEGAWVTKHNDKYYLQYAAPGAEYNVYLDGVYIADSPLGPYTLAKNNPYSYKPGGFITGAGHGSTVVEDNGNVWHTSTMRISVNEIFERRLGIWKAGFDKDGDLYCDQRYGDWPLSDKTKPWDKPEWMLLSYKKNVTTSSGVGEQNVTDEDVLTWWKANTGNDEWLQIDLGAEYDVRAIQVNFADDNLKIEIPEEKKNSIHGRYIDKKEHKTRWLLEGSCDGEKYFVIEDKSNADTDLAHDFIVRENGINVRYVKLTVKELPYNQNATVSGVRVFGKCDGALPEITKDVDVTTMGELDMFVSWEEDASVGHNILWGYAEDKLYHSCMVHGKNYQHIGALMKGNSVYLRVDAFNEVGITEGTVQKVK